MGGLYKEACAWHTGQDPRYTSRLETCHRPLTAPLIIYHGYFDLCAHSHTYPEGPSPVGGWSCSLPGHCTRHESLPSGPRPLPSDTAPAADCSVATPCRYAHRGSPPPNPKHRWYQWAFDEGGLECAFQLAARTARIIGVQTRCASISSWPRVTHMSARTPSPLETGHPYGGATAITWPRCGLSRIWSRRELPAQAAAGVEEDL